MRERVCFRTSSISLPVLICAAASASQRTGPSSGSFALSPHSSSNRLVAFSASRPSPKRSRQSFRTSKAVSSENIPTPHVPRREGYRNLGGYSVAQTCLYSARRSPTPAAAAGVRQMARALLRRQMEFKTCPVGDTKLFCRAASIMLAIRLALCAPTRT